jgi:SAM-dependent methyltransferase
MNLIERATVIHYHRHRIAQFGADHVRALGWVNAASQTSRFECIAQAIDFTDSSVLDLGCGTGDLKAFLDARFGGVSYLGIEQVPEFVAQARKRYAGDAHAGFELGDFIGMLLPRVDHVVACGSLSYRSNDPHHVYGAIAQMHTSAAQTVVFSLLDVAHFPDHPLLVGHPVDEIMAFCRKLSPRVSLLRGVSPEAVTVVMNTSAHRRLT